MKSKLITIVFLSTIIISSLAGWQLLSGEAHTARAAGETEQMGAISLPAQSPAIQDELILAGWNALRSMQEPVQVANGMVVSGESLAQFLVESQIPVVWGSEAICGGSSCSKQYCTLDGDCSFEDGQPGIDPIYLNVSIQAQSVGMMDRLARELGHEAFHRMQFFGSGKITQIEEYWAFYLDTQLVKADYPSFNGVDPQDPQQLAGWFTRHSLGGYLRLAPYPGVPEQVSQVEQGGQVVVNMDQE
jgi:hypothetical protein